CSRHAETTIANREPQVINAYGNVKQPRRPEFPARPAPNEYLGTTDFSEKQNRSADKERRENNRGDFALDEREPNQCVGAEKLSGPQKLANDDDILAASSETKLSKMIAVEARNACAIMD